MLSLKHGVSVKDLRPEILLAIQVVASAYHDASHNCIVTSVRDGKHSANSLHYKGLAADFRTYHLLPHLAEVLRDKTKSALGAEYDVVLEKDHLHVEFDPKS